MTRRCPLVSVAMITFNHERFIAAAIQSVLRQTIADLELVLVDDGSTDDTARVASGFTDPRFHFVRQENAGPGSALNRAISESEGRFIAIMSGDDVCHADRLQLQLAAHGRAGSGIVYSNMDYIDEHGDLVQTPWLPPDYFRHPDASRADALAKFFFSGNFVAAPTCFTESDMMRAVGPFDPCLYQTQDFDWVIRAVKRFNLVMMPECTVSYRVRVAAGNLSAPHPARQVRTENEKYLLMKRFFRDTPRDLFIQAFRDRFVVPTSSSPLELACEEAFLYFAHPSSTTARSIGCERLHDLFQNPEAAELLARDYRFTPARLAQELLTVDPGRELGRYLTTLCADSGGGYDQQDGCQILGNHLAEEFQLTYRTKWSADVHGVCWLPARLALCRVKLESVTWRDEDAKDHAADLCRVNTNGSPDADGFVSFDHLDPKFFLPISGAVREVTVRGRWQVDDPTTSAERVNTSLIDAQIRNRDLQIRNRDLAERLSCRRYRVVDQIVLAARNVPGIHRSTRLFVRVADLLFKRRRPPSINGQASNSLSLREPTA